MRSIYFHTPPEEGDVDAGDYLQSVKQDGSLGVLYRVVEAREGETGSCEKHEWPECRRWRLHVERAEHAREHGQLHFITWDRRR